ncbi:hypothetical protein [Actinomycetospora termitidis]|uniref:DUF4333 domain-containing protein n=1 Tax=Actinomycetospora termitidis TaxID=3053470 RepID=A0ABT7MGG8_9PSEU|nr:hypothetical protein [Actinomycetospora sp. Odt1-22]MDL5158957.1 hypothetical protein [Actinomycetospora sp. Odt1-22]
MSAIDRWLEQQRREDFRREHGYYPKETSQLRLFLWFIAAFAVVMTLIGMYADITGRDQRKTVPSVPSSAVETEVVEFGRTLVRDAEGVVVRADCPALPVRVGAAVTCTATTDEGADIAVSVAVASASAQRIDFDIERVS